jgi:hypothetical protein
VKKIPTLYGRTEDRKSLTDEVTPGCEWVLKGEGAPTRKYDGTCVLLNHNGAWWARRTVKPKRMPPSGFVEIERDPTTGITVGWEPISQSSFAACHADALEFDGPRTTVGTYELIGPKINGNPERVERHALIRHEIPHVQELNASLDPLALMDLCARYGYEGVVWHHRDRHLGDERMAKLKVRDLLGGRP